jgi:hypothetical protein
VDGGEGGVDRGEGGVDRGEGGVDRGEGGVDRGILLILVRKEGYLSAIYFFFISVVFL